MKFGIIITMFDEHKLVLSSVEEIKRKYPDSYICVVHSDDDNGSSYLEKIVTLVDKYYVLPNLALSDNLDSKKLASSCIVRNLNQGFSALYKSDYEFDCIVALTADTLITDASSFGRRLSDMKIYNRKAIVSQAIGQRFHAVGEAGDIIPEGRLQTDDSTDFACCLFFVEGQFAKKHLAFKNTNISNPYTSEQCLGDELKRCLENDKVSWSAAVGRLNYVVPYIAYSYNDGVVYHALSGRPGR